MLTHEEYLAKKAAGTLTAEDKAAQFGDPMLGGTAGRLLVENAYKAELIRRFNAGECLTKAAAKEARRYIREAKE